MAVIKQWLTWAVILFGNLNLLFAQEQQLLPFPNSRYADIQQLNMHYRQWPALTALRGHVVLVHGFCGSTFSWRHNIEALQEAGFEVLAVDVPPYGYSDRAPRVNHSPSFQADLIWKLIDQLYPERQKWSLIGHSLGGAIIGAMAARRQSQTSHVIFVDGIMKHVGAGAKPFYKWLLGSFYVQTGAEVAGKLHFFRPKVFYRLLQTAYGQSPDSIAVAGYLTPLKIKKTASRIFDMAAFSVATFEYAEVDVLCPALVIWGERDTWIPRSAGEQMHRLLPDSEFHIIKGAAHCPMETHARIFNQLVLDFLK